MEHVNIGSLRIAYQRQGRGPVLLLLHGGVSDSRVWRVELASFSDDFTVVAWDAPGCGQSTDAPEDFTMAEYACCLAAFVDALGLGPVHVLGHSWGSTLALELCQQRRDLVRSLVLVGSYAGWAGSLAPDEVESRLEFALATAEALPLEPSSIPGLFSDVMPVDRTAELMTVMSQIRAPATRTMAKALAAADLRNALTDIDVPTLIVAGEQDIRSTLTIATDLARRLPNASLVVLAGLGHECYLESPAAFDAAIRPFLTGQ
jgi:pimeloyl-ACP methyl ester carboxylesterase